MLRSRYSPIIDDFDQTDSSDHIFPLLLLFSFLLHLAKLAHSLPDSCHLNKRRTHLAQILRLVEIIELLDRYIPY